MKKEKVSGQDAHSGATQTGPDVPPWVSGKVPHTQRPQDVDGRGYFFKRPFDMLLSFIGLAISSPLWLIFSIAIKLEDRGPILFVQERWGKDRSKILIYKFRTMVPNAVEKFGNVQASKNDPRVTKVGRLLRATSLDEMPQLLNIFKGDMSWVGPRALPINEVQVNEEKADVPDEDVPGFNTRSKLSPGLTGIHQVFSPRDVPRELKYQYDALYCGNQSLWLDIRLIVLSLWITLRAKWEARGSKL